MRNAVDLDWLAAHQVLDQLPGVAARGEVLKLTSTVLADRDAWPAPGGEEVADFYGARCWASVVAYDDGIEVRDIGWYG
ncbi:hypothetical protein OG372_00165 [Streptomyces sp. NBC_01020]|uniref:hypothetical protein n=1 Tax=unclassified Streptomyces TaxID=2593676 RepID=UPI002E1EF326|nr:hypothetical protein OG372_00165 [Streptomyces sp. NBC_01020]WSX65153.1 hypothetical protein OG221_00175 [Streptomyces sp. NBC_00932]